MAGIRPSARHGRSGPILGPKHVCLPSWDAWTNLMLHYEIPCRPRSADAAPQQLDNHHEIVTASNHKQSQTTCTRSLRSPQAGELVSQYHCRSVSLTAGHASNTRHYAANQPAPAPS